MGGTFFVPYLSWGASWGYWTDGIEHALPIIDLVTLSQISQVVAARIEFHPRVLDSHVPIPISLFAGVAEHFVNYKYVGGFDYFGGRGFHKTDQSFTAFVGLGVLIPVLSYLKLEAEARQFIPFDGDEIDQAQKNRRAFTFGFAANF